MFILVSESVNCCRSSRRKNDKSDLVSKYVKVQVGPETS